MGLKILPDGKIKKPVDYIFNHEELLIFFGRNGCSNL